MTDDRERPGRAAALVRAANNDPARTAEELLSDARLFGDDAGQDLALCLGILLSEGCNPPRARPAAERANRDPQVKHAVALAVALERAAAAAAALDPFETQRIQGIADRVRVSAALLGDVVSCLIASHRAGRLARASWQWPDHARALYVGAGEFALRAEHGSPTRRTRAQVRLTAQEEISQAAAVILSRPAGPVRDDTGTDPRDPDHPDFEPDDEAEEAPPAGVRVVPPLTHLGETKSGPRAEFRSVAGRHLPVAAAPDPEAVHAALLRQVPWAPALADAVAGDLVGAPYARVRPTLLAGPPGSGKTSAALALGGVLALPTTLYAAAGVSDGQFGGTSRAYGTGRASVPLQAIRRAGQASVLVVIDEGDKAGTSDHNGNLISTLLPYLESSSARRLFDPYLEIEVDLSPVSYVITANELGRVSGPLRDRCRVVHVPRPGTGHLDAIAPRVAEALAAERGMHPAEAQLDAAEMECLREHWRGGSLRALQAAVGVCLDSRAFGPRH